MSPAPPAVGFPASMSGVSGLLGIPSGFVDIVDFNGIATQLPALAGPNRVGVQHFTIEHDLEFRFLPPAVCNDANASLPEMRRLYGEDGVSFINETCSGLRHIPVSVFYPTCESLQQPQHQTAPVFTQSLLETITAQVFEDPKSMHNLESRAFPDASICPDKYSMVILSPPIGGQRQAYTQLASDIASHHHVVVTVDHMFQSGAIELENGNLLFNLAGDFVKPREANFGRVIDLMAVAMHFNESLNLDTLFWTPGIEIDLRNTYVFGHGQGGQVARMMVASNLLSGGGTLDHLIRMPAPYNESNIMHKPLHKDHRETKPGSEEDTDDLLDEIAAGMSDGFRERLKNIVRGLKKTVMDSLSTLLCRVLGTCGTVVQKRGLDSTSHDHGIWHPHEEESCDDLCFFHCKLECKPDVPHGLFPDDLGQSSGKTRPDDGDWDEEWNDYRDSIGDYKGYPGRDPRRQHEKSCYDDDYCNFKCCSKDYSHDDDADWEDENESYRHHHENQEADRDQQDERQGPHHSWDEDEVPLSRPKGVLSPPDVDEGVEVPAGTPKHQPNDGGSPDDDVGSEDDKDDSDDNDDDSDENEDDDEDDSDDNEDDSDDGEDDSDDNEDDSDDGEDVSKDDEGNSDDDAENEDDLEDNEDRTQDDENSENEL